MIFIKKTVWVLNEIKLTTKKYYDEVLFILIYLLFYFLMREESFQSWFIYSVVYLVLAHTALIDLKKRIIPDKYSIGLIIIGLIINISKNNYLQIIVALLCGICFIALVCLFEKLLKKEIIGGGDCKLLTALFLLLGIKETLLFFAFSQVILLVDISFFKKERKNEMVPLVPYLFMGYVLEIFLLNF